MTEIKRLILAPLSYDSKANYILQTSGLCFAKERRTFEDFISLISVRSDVAVTVDIFDLIPVADPFWKGPLKDKVKLLAELSDIDSLPPLCDPYVVFNKALTLADSEKLERFMTVHPQSKLVYLENKLHIEPSPFASLSNALVDKCYVSFLPKISSLDPLFDEAEVIERIDLREREFASRNLDLRLLVFQVDETSSLRTFYSEPTPKKYFFLLKNINEVTYYAIEFVIFFKALIYPFKKIYWFCEYQFKKRILKVFQQKTLK